MPWNKTGNIAGSDGAGLDAATAPAKAVPVDADDVILLDSEAGKAFRRLSWSAIKNAFATWYNSHVATLSNKTFDATVPIHSETGSALIAARSDDTDDAVDIVLEPQSWGRVVIGHPEDQTYVCVTGGLAAYGGVFIQAEHGDPTYDGAVDIFLQPAGGSNGDKGKVQMNDFVANGTTEISGDLFIIGNCQINGLTPATTTGVESLLNKTLATPILRGAAVVQPDGFASPGAQTGLVASVVPVTPNIAGAAGIVGQIAVTATHLYVCIGNSAWRRVALETF